MCRQLANPIPSAFILLRISTMRDSPGENSLLEHYQRPETIFANHNPVPEDGRPILPQPPLRQW